MASRKQDDPTISELDDFASSTDDDRHRVRLEHRLLKARDELRRSESDNKILHRELQLAQRQLEIALTTQDAPRAPVIRKKQKAKKNQCAAFMVGSDWHTEERVDPLTVNNRNEYSPEIFEQRVERFFVNGLRLVDIQRAGAQIDVLVLALLGDQITGYIHDEFVESNFLSPTEAIRLCQGRIISGLDYLLARGDFERIIVPCCFGNHGRTTTRRRITTGAKNSFEWLMFHTIADHFKDEKRLEFVIADGAHIYLEVYGLTVRLTHGDDIRYHGGVGGLTVPLRKAVDAWDVFKRASLSVFGHWHTLDNYGSWAVGNGSLIGFNAYALSIKARFEPPQQAFFLIDAERKRKTGAFPIFVT